MRSFVSVIDGKPKMLPEGYSNHPKRKYCKRGHLLTEDNVYYMSNGHRWCKACTIRLVKEHAAKKKSGVI